MQKWFQSFLKPSQVLDDFRNTDTYQPFHTGSRVFLQRQENQREKEGSESKMKVVRLDVQFELLKMPTMADGVSFKMHFLKFTPTKISERRHRDEEKFSLNFSDAEKATSVYIQPLG